MRRLLPVGLLVLGGLLLGLWRSDVSDGDAVRKLARPKTRRPEVAMRALPVEPRADEPVRLLGSPAESRASRAGTPAPETPWLEPTCATDVVARLVHAGTSIERLWAEYVSNRADPGRRERIDRSALGLETSPPDPFWQPRGKGSPAPVRARLRLLKVHGTFLRDHGIDTHFSHTQLDAGALRVLDDALRRTETGIRLEDEHSVRITDGQVVDVFLRDTATWPPLDARRRVPLGAVVHLRADPFAGRTSLTLGILVRVAFTAPTDPDAAETDGVAIRQSARCSITMPTGRTVLFMMRSPIWVPPGTSSRADRTADSWVPIVLAQMEVE